MDVVARLLHILPAKKQVPKETATLERKSKRLITHEGWSPPQFDPGCVRFVLYQDHEVRGKKQVFDSKAYLNSTNTEDIHSLTQSLNNDDSLTSSVTNSIGTSLRSKPPLFKRPSSDSELLGEMMFGSMPMKLVGNSVKIHYIRSEEQLMITKVFLPQKKMPSTCSLTDFSDSCPLPAEAHSRHIDQPQTHKQSSFHYSLRPPSSSPDSLPKFYSQSYSNAHYSPYHSPTASLPLSLANSSGSHDYSPTQSLNIGVPISTSSLTSSLTRRLQRIRSTSLENGSELYHRVLKPMDQPSSSRRGRKYAIGVIFCLSSMKPVERKQFQEFFFSHFTLISSSLEQLREKVEETLWNRKPVLSDLVLKAFNSFVEDFQALYCAQRIKSPVWLEIVSGSTSKREVCVRFLTELSTLMHQLENKESKFFLSSLLTTVLSYHLAWVYTVSKSGSTTTRHHDRTTSKSLAVLAETHPYNPLWAQFGDLCGAVSDPLTVCRTIVVGKSASLVCRLLYLLTYFIRCSEIEERGMFKVVNDSHAHLETGELGESDIFAEESRTGSALTLLSETERNTGPFHSTSIETRVAAPLVKPHPFSFSHTGSMCSSNGSFQELNKTFVTQSCGSLDGHSTHRPAPTFTPKVFHSKLDSNICRSVPTRMVEPPSLHTNNPYTPFISYHTHGTGIITTNTTDSSNNNSVGIYQPETGSNSSTTTNWNSNEIRQDSLPANYNSISSNINSSVNSKLQGESSTESLSTGYQTISRNPSGTSLGASYPSHSQTKPHPQRQGTCSSFDSGVFDQPSLIGLPTESGRFTVDSLQFSSLSAGINITRPPSMSQEIGSCPQPGHTTGINPESSLRLFNSVKYNHVISSESTFSRERSNAFSFGIDDSEEACLANAHSNSIESHALSHDKLHNTHLMHSSPNHVITGITMHQVKGNPSLSQSYDSRRHYNHYYQMHSSSLLNSISPKTKCSSNPSSSFSLKCNSSPSLSSMAKPHQLLPRNQSYKGLPVIEGVCPELDGSNTYHQYEEDNSHLKIQHIDVQESLSPVSLSYLSHSLDPGMEFERNGMKFQQQFKDFSNVDINDLESEINCDLLLSPLLSSHSVSTNSTPRLPHSAIASSSPSPFSTCFNDFGHSLMVGYSEHYMPHFVLHGTSQPYTEFKDKLISDLSAMVKYSIIDEPVEHGVAIVADTDTLTCKVVAVSKSRRTVEGEIFTSVSPSAYSVQQLLHSVASLWEMQMPPEFCLSHLEDCLMSLNERGQALSNSLLDQGNFSDIAKTLQKLHSTLNTNPSDKQLLHALAGVHVSNSNRNLSKELQTMCLHSLSN